MTTKRPTTNDRTGSSENTHVSSQPAEDVQAETATTQDVHLQHAAMTTTDLIEGDEQPPAYGEISNEKTGNSARVTDDGRVDIRINHLHRRASLLFNPALRQQLKSAQASRPQPPPYLPSSLGGRNDALPPPPLNVVIHVVGSRGDVQPFIALAKVLQETYGHRVRLATHLVFASFVREQGLEFFNIGGDPSQLMAFMVKNSSLVPSFRSVVNGDVTQRRRDVGDYIQGCWRSCYETGDGMGSRDGSDDTNTTNTSRPFVADCIIANPPSFAHIHCAEKLGIPLHIMFTMPYSPTQAFPHPLANIQSTNTDPQLTNYISYAMIELLTWQGLGDIINRFRLKCLGLDPISMIWAPGMLQRLVVPHTYCWSPALIPKPADWGSHISIAGFYFLNAASDYTPSADLQAFLDAGPPPIYIGFGSIVLNDPDAMTQLIFDAAKRSGQRVLLSKGWGGIGADKLRVPDGIFMLGNVPHDWLFKHVSCVVHHGGAGTTAAGISAGRPTVVVPFFGDQPFWGAMVARSGAGPDPIPHSQLTAERLADAIAFCLKPESLQRAKALASKISDEQGCDTGALSFHQYLEPNRLRCDLAPSRTAVWRVKRSQFRLSAFAAQTLSSEGLLRLQDLKLFRAQEYETDPGPVEPVSGGFTAFVGVAGEMMGGLADFPAETWRAFKVSGASGRQRAQVSRPNSSKQQEGLIAKGQLTPEQISLTSDVQHSSTLEEDDKSLLHPSDPTSTAATSSSATTLRGSSTLSRHDPGPSSSRSNDATVYSNDKDMLRPTGVHTSRGAGRLAKAIIEGPMEISVNMTRGAHNLPKLWGDDTVRPQEQVTDFTSGVRAVGKEFGYGFYDGITGLVTQPWKGARKGGIGGFFKGVGKGVGGFGAKPTAALLSVPAYLMKGASKSAQSMFSNDVQGRIMASRTMQGHEEWLQSSAAEKQEVIERWKMVQKGLKKKRGNAEAYTLDSHSPQAATTMNGRTNSSSGLETLPRAGTLEDGNAASSSMHEQYLQRVLPQSAREARRSSSSEWSSNVALDSDEDEAFVRSEKAAVASSSAVVPQEQHAHDPGHLAGMTKSEHEAPQQQGEKTAQELSEEEIVLAYVKKQSLLEEQLGWGKRREGGDEDEEEDEELQRALVLSLQTGSGANCN